QNGLPADFRLVGATTRSPQDIPPALRSRCMEIYFRPLLPDEISLISRDAIQKIGLKPSPEAVSVVQKYATNGREAVNMVQLAAGLALTEQRDVLSAADVEWVAGSSQLPLRTERKIPSEPQVGIVNGLAVCGPGMGMLLEIEVSASPAANGAGRLNITGVVDEEEIGGGSRTLRRKSMAKGSVENVLTVLRSMNLSPDSYDLHVNFPGGTPIDGPSAGVAMAVAIVSAIRGLPVDNTVAMTGEIGIRGKVKPVGGVVAKVEAALQAGATTVLVPKDNWQSLFADLAQARVIPIETVEEVFRLLFGAHLEDVRLSAVAGDRFTAPPALLKADASGESANL
ncbi:S16 family serine protease, partial [Paenibacillus forsythiae]